MKSDSLSAAMKRLAGVFAERNWRYLRVPEETNMEKVYAWPGKEDEEIMICVHTGTDIHEEFHRQDFFFFNFAYCGDYGAISYKYDNHITVHEGECYIGQPSAGYALAGHSAAEIKIIGVLIQKESFFRHFLSVLAADGKLFRFFLDPTTNAYSDEYIRLKIDDELPVRRLLELMVLEYASPQPDTQVILKPLVLSLLMQIARQYRKSTVNGKDDKLSDRIVHYMSEHTDVVTLKEVAAHFSYHPNYISGILRKELETTFSQLLLKQRMEKAAMLLNGTDLSVEEIAAMLGYSNNSNFYKAFRDYYGSSPRDYVSKQKSGLFTETWGMHTRKDKTVKSSKKR